MIKVGTESTNDDSNVLVIILYLLNECLWYELSCLVCSGKKLLRAWW